MVSRKYTKRLKNYLQWAERGGRLFTPLDIRDDPNASVDADSAMFAWESRGTPLPSIVRHAELLTRYVQGKRSRDWHLTEWKEGVRRGLFLAQEFEHTLGATTKDINMLYHVTSMGDEL